MPSPTRALRRSPPRQPLHERSESEANERTSPTSRTINDPQDSFYKSSPYPTHPSHILSPRHASRPGLVPKVFEDDEGIPMQENPPSDAAYDFTSHKGNKRRSGLTFEEGENGFEHSVRPLSIGNPLPIAIAPLNFNPAPDQVHMEEEGIGERNRSWDEIVQLPSVSSLPQSQESFAPFPKTRHSLNQHPVEPKSSDHSLSSSESAGTIIRHKVRPGRGSYSAFPPVNRSSSSKSSNSPSTPQRGFIPSSDDGSPVSPASASSETFPTPEIRQASSTTVSRPHRAVSDVVNLQYPEVRQPSASGSRAESSNDLQYVTIRRPQPRPERNQDRWNPHLSTVPSEFTEDRGSDGVGMPTSADMSTTSLTGPSSGQSATDQQRDMTGSTIRIVNESDDNVSNLLSPIPGSRGSAFYSVLSGGSRNKRKSVPQARPTSKGSFFRDSIPAWAKLYYARSNSALALTGGRQEVDPAVSSESLGKIGVRRTRPKPSASNQNQADRDSMAIGPAQPHLAIHPEMQNEPRQTIMQTWSPHLWQDRRNIGQRRSVFRAPTLDQHVEGPFGRRNVQVLLFTIGFVFPLGKSPGSEISCHADSGFLKAWFAASVLPLPRKPIAIPEDPATDATFAHDLEKTLGMVDEARYENARWWRNLNRLMCIVGVLVLGAIIALAVVAVRMRK
ncbi:MAG: hypothetical protein Q9222_001517 [Ikaeria aurantiellina]